MRMLDCRDVVSDCDMVYTGLDDDEVVRFAAAHLRRSHREWTVDDELLRRRLLGSIVPLG
jgi:predicted small metal-binding protein